MSSPETKESEKTCFKRFENCAELCRRLFYLGFAEHERSSEAFRRYNA